MRPDASIAEAIRIIDKGAAQIALIVDADLRLLGTLTDGDIRRGLLHGVTLESFVEKVMHREFYSVSANCNESQAMQIMREKGLHQIPVLDDEGHVLRLFLL